MRKTRKQAVRGQRCLGSELMEQPLPSLAQPYSMLPRLPVQCTVAGPGLLGS